MSRSMENIALSFQLRKRSSVWDVISGLSGMVPHSASGPGGGSGGGPAAHVDPIFVPSDLLRVWSLSLLLSIAAGIMPAWKASRLSPLEALRRT
jgi:putative ABC transport system permease protein